MANEYYKLSSVIFERYGIEKGIKILCHANIRNLIKLYGK